MSRSLQSYCELLHSALEELASRQKKSPRYDELLVQQHHHMIAEWIQQHHHQTHNDHMRVLALDECHTAAVEICGYGWGNPRQPPELELENYRESQTSDRVWDCISGEMLLSPYQNAHSSSTMKLVDYLQA